MKRMFLVKLLFSISIIEICGAFDVTLTTNVSPGGRECFAHKVAADSQYELEYQVVSGGELDITFSLYTADGIKVIDDVKRSSKVYRDQAAEDGEVEFCFDNSFSHFSTKAVFFHLKVAEEETATTAVMDDIAEAQELLPFEITYENFKTSTYQVSNNLRRSVELQRVFSHIELRDRSIQGTTLSVSTSGLDSS